MYYETDRLILRVLHEAYAPKVLDFYMGNKEYFEEWEPDRPPNFYTLEYQAALLKCEFEMAAKMTAVRFWIFRKDAPDTIIGTVSFQNVLRFVYQSCSIGYKLDANNQHQGFATEAIGKALSIIKKELNLHRVEALVLPENHSSIHLLERLGFEKEGICRSCIFLHNNWTDNLRYSLIL